MTFYGNDTLVPVLKVKREDENGDYERLRNGDDCISGSDEELGEIGPPSPRMGRSLWWWLKAVLMCISLGILVAVGIIWVEPLVMDKEVIPILDWEVTTFSTPVLAIVLFASVALFPILLLPSTPSMWVAGMSFGYGFGFLLIISGAFLGMSLPYFIGSLFNHKIQRWLERSPKKAAIVRLAGEGGWFHQFRVVTLLRISPFPYVLFNYAVVATNVKYGPYILGSLVGLVPEIFVAIYSGILIRSLADAAQDQHSLSAPQIVFNILGFLITIVVTVAITIYGRRQLKKLQKQEELLLE